MNALQLEPFAAASRDGIGPGFYADVRLDLMTSSLPGLEQLWDGDHFVTQLNPDGTTRDFVDYDANLLATAFVPMSDERRKTILRRIDGGNCTHAAPGTYISERLYGPDDVYSCDAAKPDIRCVGDSRVSYGRVAWLDAITRKLVGDHDALERLCIAPIRAEVFKLVWTHERYNCRGTPVHSPYYYEYPAVLGTIVRDVQYGVSFGFAAEGVGSFHLDPFATSSNRTFAWAIGQLAIEYAPPSRACFTLPVQWANGTECTVTGLAGNRTYTAVTTSRGGGVARTVAVASSTGVVQLRLLLKALDSTCLTLEPRKENKLAFSHP